MLLCTSSSQLLQRAQNRLHTHLPTHTFNHFQPLSVTDINVSNALVHSHTHTHAHPLTCTVGTLRATDPGPACLQRGRFAKTNSSEDCLRLHVWAPWESAVAPPPATRSVVVWLHGGDLVEGSSFTAQSYYASQANLTRFADAIVVGVEYRFAGPSL